MKKNILFAYLVLMCITSNFSFAQNRNILWFDKPAEHFEEAIVLGNGKTGASVFGGVDAEQIYLNDATLWSGEPVKADMNPDAYKNIPAIREALFNEDYRQADRLNKSIQGKFSESYMPFGTLNVKFRQTGAFNNYRRQLDIGKALSTLSYNQNGTRFTREYFVSHPDNALVVKITASTEGALSFTISFNSQLKYKTASAKNTLLVNGYAPYHVAPDYWRETNPVRFAPDRGTRFSSGIRVKNKGGVVAVTDSTITVNNADEAILYITTATSFNGFDKDPVKNGLDSKTVAKKQLEQAAAKNYVLLKRRHVADYQKYFNRVDLDLEAAPGIDKPTPERLKNYTAGADDKNLEALYFQYARYLLISSSRVKGVPANLQGIWNPYIRPPWSSNYTMNINVEENYWLAEAANLSEMHMPFLSFIKNVSVTGKVTAKNFYGVKRGWASAHNSDIWAMSNPVGDFGKGEPVWACWNMSGAWVVTHLWSHYQYTGDKAFLKDFAYPLMKGAALFCLDWLVKDKHGYLVTAPSTSPENSFITDKGVRASTLYGSTADMAIIRECFQQTIAASKLLKVDGSLRDSIKMAMAELYPYKIGKKGNLQEWYYDWDDSDPKHRHQTHLYGVYPGHQISREQTPDLAAAAEKTLKLRGDETTGWSKGWRINLWARLNDGNHAYKMFRELLTYVPPDGAKNINYTAGGGTYPNLLDAHPPFQIDGNFGGAAGVVEMLLQSTENNISLLPSLPDAWPNGKVKGLCAKGGFELTLIWKKGRLTSAEVLSKKGQLCTLNYKGKKISFATKPMHKYKIDGGLTKL